ncbi:glycosyltransferase family 2 protein [Azospirillum sp. sgz301742]
MTGAPLFTVFTPTYNRAATLPRVFASLAAQTCRDFEWLVIDDGSQDDTPAVLAALRERADFPIRSLRQDNAGKHRAIDRGVREAHGRFFLILDSDDSCVPTALERLAAVWETIPADEREGFVGVSVLCRDEHGERVGDPFPASPLDASMLDIDYRHKVRGEKWGFVRTDVLRRFPFPHIEGTNFIPEGVVWHRIARHYRLRCVNEDLRVYHRDEPGGLTGAVRTRSATAMPGLLLYHSMVLNEETDWFASAPASFFKSAANLVRYGLHGGQGLGAVYRGLSTPLGRALFAAALPLGVLLYAAERLRNRRA